MSPLNQGGKAWRTRGSHPINSSPLEQVEIFLDGFRPPFIDKSNWNLKKELENNCFEI